MELNPSLFWDTDPEKLDYDQHARYIMSRVVSYGKWSEWKQLLNFYGRERIASELTRERELDIKSVHFLSVMLDIPLKDFTCYSGKP